MTQTENKAFLKQIEFGSKFDKHVLMNEKA